VFKVVSEKSYIALIKDNKGSVKIC